IVAAFAILVAGMAVLSSSKVRPSSNFVTTTSCLRPERVSIVPVAPAFSGPSSRDAFMSGFHSGQLFTSDQICQTRAGDALVSSEASRYAMSSFPSPKFGCSPAESPEFSLRTLGEGRAARNDRSRRRPWCRTQRPTTCHAAIREPTPGVASGHASRLAADQALAHLRLLALGAGNPVAADALLASELEVHGDVAEPVGELRTGDRATGERLELGWDRVVPAGRAQDQHPAIGERPKVAVAEGREDHLGEGAPLLEQDREQEW